MVGEDCPSAESCASPHSHLLLPPALHYLIYFYKGFPFAPSALGYKKYYSSLANTPPVTN